MTGKHTINNSQVIKHSQIFDTNKSQIMQFLTIKIARFLLEIIDCLQREFPFHTQIKFPTFMKTKHARR